jgi:hypothetical protein
MDKAIWNMLIRQFEIPFHYFTHWIIEKLIKFKLNVLKQSLMTKNLVISKYLLKIEILLLEVVGVAALHARP